MMDGLSLRRTADGVPVLRVHYTADPAKRPGTPEGEAWLAHAVQGVLGGIRSARWRREMEIDYGALGGTLVFPGFHDLARTVCPPPYSADGMKLYGAYDHGYRNPACFLVIGHDRDRRPVVLWQLYAAGVGVRDLAACIQGKSIRTTDGRAFAGNPHAGNLVRIIADPSLWKDDQHMDDGTMKSVAELFRRHGVYMSPGKRGGDTTVAQWLQMDYWRDPAHPGCLVTCPSDLLDADAAFSARGYAGPGAPCLVWELGRLRFRDWSEGQSLHHSFKEEIEDKDNHAWDAFKYHLQEFSPHPTGEKARADAPPNSFAWWREVAKKARRGEPVPTYQRQMIG